MQKGISFDALVRESTDTSLVEQYAEDLVLGDITDREKLADLLAGYERCIHIPNLAAVKDVDRYIKVYEDSDLKKVVFVSSTNMFTKLPASTKPRREAAEVAIMKSGLNYVIIRPTMIYGGEDDRNICRLVQIIKNWPVFPVFNGGRAMQQPIYVKDHAQALVYALISDETNRKCYNISGKEPFTYQEMVSRLATVLDERIKIISVPVAPIYSITRMLERMHIPVPFRSEQLLRLVEDKYFDHQEAAKDFGFNPRSFEEGIIDGYWGGK